MNINTISVKQLRENFGELKAGLEEGLSYLLIYRSKPIAEIKPVIERNSTIKIDVNENTNKRIQKIKVKKRSSKQLGGPLDDLIGIINVPNGPTNLSSTVDEIYYHD